MEEIGDDRPECPVSPRAFKGIRDLHLDTLSNLEPSEIRPLLPCLVRMSLCLPLDKSEEWTQQKKLILKILSGMDVVNSIVMLLAVDFNQLEQDARVQQQLRRKQAKVESSQRQMLNTQTGASDILVFEKSDPKFKLQSIISELTLVIDYLNASGGGCSGEFLMRTCYLLSSPVYLDDVSDVICIAQAELSSILSLKLLAEALLRYENGAKLLCHLVANVPDSFYEVCEVLESQCCKFDSNSQHCQVYCDGLRMLCRVNPEQALSVRALTVEKCVLPGLVIALSLDHHSVMKHTLTSHIEEHSQVVAFVSGLLLGCDTYTRSWFSLYIRNSQKKPDDESNMVWNLRQYLFKELKQLTPDSEHNELTTLTRVIQSCCILRLYCALKGIATIKYNNDEAAMLLQLITSRPPTSPAGNRFITIGLSMLLACPFIISTNEQEKSVVNWIKWLASCSGDFSSSTGSTSSFGQMLLLIAIHFHNNQFSAIAELVCSTLSMKIPVRGNSLAKLKTIFTQEVFTEQVVTAHSVTVPPTSHLSSTIAGYLPIHCIYQLLKTRDFSRDKISVRDWIYKQIVTSEPPLHPLLPPLVEVFVNSVIVPSGRCVTWLDEPFTEAQVTHVFKDCIVNDNIIDSKQQHEDIDTQYRSSSHSNSSHNNSNSGNRRCAQLLMLYYLLMYKDVQLNNMKVLATQNIKTLSYSSKLMEDIPIKYLVYQAQISQHHYSVLYPQLLKLTVIHYPHLCQAADWLFDESSDTGMRRGVRPTTVTVSQFSDAVMKLVINPGEFIDLSEKLLQLPATKLLPYTNVIVYSLPRLLESKVPRRAQDLMVQLWKSLNTVIPRKLNLLTVNVIQDPHRSVSVRSYTDNDVTVDPLIVLRCDQRIFRCPPLLSVILTSISAYLAACHSYLSTHLQSNPKVESRPKEAVAAALPPLGASAFVCNNDLEREELKNALATAQETAVAQLLLEICLPTVSEREANVGKLSVLQEVRSMVCSYLHHVFISDTNHCKLLHFQGYSSQLLPVTVSGIPSMHICLDFIHELIQQPQLQKKIFAIELCSYLSVQYPLPKSYSIARLCVNITSTLLSVLTDDNRREFFVCVVTALARLCQAFPPLCKDVVSILVQLGQISTSQLAERGLIAPQGNREADDTDNVKRSCHTSSRELNSSERNNEDLSLTQAVYDAYTQLLTQAIINKI